MISVQLITLKSIFFEKVNCENSQQTTKGMTNYTACKGIKSLMIELYLGFAYLVILYAFCRLLMFLFQNQPFRKNISGIQSECQTVGIQIRTDVLDDTSRQIFNKTLIYSELSQYRKLYLFQREMKGK